MSHAKGSKPRRILKASRNWFWQVSRSPRRWYSDRTGILSNLPTATVGIEMGVFKGEFSREILEHVRPRELHLVDVWWTVFGDHYPDWGAYTDHGTLTTRAAYEGVQRIAEPFADTTRVHLHAGDDVIYLDELADHSLDWAYIDSSHQYEHTLRELEALNRTIASDGWIMGHDWCPDPMHRHHAVCQAVLNFCQDRSWRIAILDNHHQWAIRRCK